MHEAWDSKPANGYSDANDSGIAAVCCLHARPECAEAPAAATAAFNAYVSKVESRLAEQHRSWNGFLVSVGSSSETDPATPARRIDH